MNTLVRDSLVERLKTGDSGKVSTTLDEIFDKVVVKLLKRLSLTARNAELALLHRFLATRKNLC